MTTTPAPMTAERFEEIRREVTPPKTCADQEVADLIAHIDALAARIAELERVALEEAGRTLQFSDKVAALETELAAAKDKNWAHTALIEAQAAVTRLEKELEAARKPPDDGLPRSC